MAAALISLAGALLWYSTRPALPYTLAGNRRELASGACAVFSPTDKNLHRTVFLDPGHGGPDPGASGVTTGGTPLDEKTLTLAVAQDALPLLRREGYTVALSRIADAPVGRLTSSSLQGGLYTPAGVHGDVQARVDCANAAGAQLLLSIHFNSYGDSTVGGVETYYDPDRSFAGDSLRFANLVQQSVLSGFAARGWNVPDRSVIADTSLNAPTLTTQASSYGHLLELGPADPGWFDRPSTMPGALSESLFLTDPGEADVIASPEGRQVLAQAYVDAIDKYFSSRS